MRHVAQRQPKTLGVIFIISGPSGSGKTTLLKRLTRTRGLAHKLVKSVSFTTRPKRTGEQSGRAYRFISKESFQEKLKQKKILEWTRYLGYYYATPKDFVERNLARGKHLLLCLDLRGARRIKKLYPKNTVTIFVLPPSLSVLRDRITMRCLRTRQEEVAQRLRLARQEIAAKDTYDYYVHNSNLAKASESLKRIIENRIHRLSQQKAG